MAAGEPGHDPIGDDARLDSLDERLKAAQDAEAARTGTAQTKVDANYSLGNRVLADLIAGVGGGALIGWVLDRLIGTTPWLLLAFMFLGIAVAFRNIFRLSKQRPD